MKHLLLNSAMMPAPGNYSLRELSAADFGSAVKAAYLDDTLVSYIGYQQTADLISDLASVPIPLNRAETHVANGDVLLIARLKYRVGDPVTKGAPVDADAFAFYYCGFTVHASQE